MPTKTSIIGFIGIDNYDIILYMAKLLNNLKKKVLIIDNSEWEALTYCIPIPESLNPKNTHIHFQNMEFIKNRNALEFNGEYDYILIDFGFKAQEKEYTQCLYLFLVTDKQQHNIARIKELKIGEREAYLIIKDVTQRISAVRLYEDLKEYNLNLTDYFYLYNDDVDKENMVALQYNSPIKLKKLSSQFKSMLYQILSEIFGFDLADIGQAYKNAKRGA